MTPVEVILTTALVLLCFMVGLWLISLAIHDSSIVDIFWGPGFLDLPTPFPRSTITPMGAR